MYSRTPTTTWQEMLGFRSFEVEGIPARAIVPRRNNSHHLGSNKRVASHTGNVSNSPKALRSTSGLRGDKEGDNRPLNDASRSPDRRPLAAVQRRRQSRFLVAGEQGL